jgi:flavin-binding protein dodecin
MSGNTYRLTEIVGTSDQNVEDAIRVGIAKASETLRNLDWFQVTEVRGSIADGAVAEFQVSMKVGFRVD